MQQFQFVLRNLRHAEAIQRDLVDNGISASQLKFFSRDKNALSHLNVSAASFWDERDIPHMMMRGGLIGFGISLAIVAMLKLSIPDFSLLPLSLLILFLTMFSTWLGGLIGFNNENYKLAGHHKDLLHGEAVLVINSRNEQLKIIEKTMSVYDLDIHHIDSTDSAINPLSGWRLVHHPDD